MTSPLDLTGPEFLGFYLVYGSVVFLLAWALRAYWSRWSGWSGWSSAPVAPATARWRPGVYPTEGDAPAIALLRGGSEEVARTLLGRLVAEECLVLNGAWLRVPTPPQPNTSRLPALEAAALRAVNAAAAAGEIGAREALAHVMAELEPSLEPLRRELEEAGLAPDSEQKQSYLLLGFAALVLVTGLGAAKLVVAFVRGRSNVLFLTVLLVASVFLAVWMMRPPGQTGAGRRYLDWLRKSHRSLARMLADGKRQSFGELALVVGIFGLAGQPRLSPLQAALIPPPTAAGAAGGSCSSGIGCDGGGGSSCSSGCGGGGGCGGCGG